jgi:hypothetical protein
LNIPAVPEPHSGTDRLAFLRRVLILAVLYTIPAVAVMHPVLDYDIWWHLRTGEWIIEHRAVPLSDPFSAYGQDKPWIAYSWLFEVLVALLYRAFGLTGLLVYRVVMSFAVLVVVHRLIARREPRFVMASFLTAVAFIALCPLLSERPWLFTILFFTLTLDVVLRLRDGTATWLVWLLPVVYVLWANLHIQFIYGLALLVLACVTPVIDGLLKRNDTAVSASVAWSRSWWQLVAISTLCALATLLNPYHVWLYGVIVEYATQPVAFAVVSELSAPEFRSPTDWAFLALGAAAAFALGRRTRVPLFELLLMVGAAYFAFHARRDLWVLVLASLAILTDHSAKERPSAERKTTLALGGYLLVVPMILVVLLMIGWWRELSEEHLAEAVGRAFPVKAVAAIGEVPGPLFNEFDWGGYLILALPNHPVSMDGRTNLHGEKRIERNVKTAQGIRWNEDGELTSARLIVIRADGPLAAILKTQPGYHVVYEDFPDKYLNRSVDNPNYRRAIVFTMELVP